MSGRVSQFQGVTSKEDLLRTLGHQLNMDFADYEKWTRKTKVTRPPPPPREGAVSTSFMVGRIKSGDSYHRGKAPTYREKKVAAKQLEMDKERHERMKILELRLRTRKKTLEEYKKRSKEFLLNRLEQNMKLAEDINSNEEATLNHVKGLLRRYEKYRGGITTLNTNFVKDYDSATQKLDSTRERTNAELTDLEAKVAELDDALKEKQEELNVLTSYKDKEYPVKAMRIATLQKEMQNLKIANQEDQEDLEHIVYTELSKYEKERVRNANLITKDITEQAISVMHPSLKDMALQNMVMKKEIESHKKEQEEILLVNKALEREVEVLLRDPKTNVRLQMFPEFFPAREK
ncbi:hypothetical protein FSP39_024293 [Pinctada imbricata]|uniref:Uncharacterized protein n=1 Tax=Pinctada imbricata TaxID=66713 RepID=A0AA88XJH7_PINIB|nr:hypothetical protein FSP39_024293 [Pinctada imbricata]